MIVNPASGVGEHADSAPRRAREEGFEVWKTSSPGDGVDLGRRAAREDVSELAVCGGDGTVNEVLRGLDAGDHLAEVTLSVVPAGTANLLARNVGVRDVDHGFDIADGGTVRSVDVGIAAGRPFVVSCIAGLPASASTAASGALKERLGTLAFVVTGVREALSFDGLSLSVEPHGERADRWEGEAITVLVGNARRFVHGGGQANAEDGALDVSVVERMPPGEMVTEAAVDRLLGRDTEHVTHFRTPEVRIRGREGEPITFSRDGELAEHDDVVLSVRERTLDLRVGDDYVPRP